VSIGATSPGPSGRDAIASAIIQKPINIATEPLYWWIVFFVGLGLACLLSGARGAWLAGAGVFAGGVAAKLGSAAVERGVLPAAALGLAVDVVLCAVFLFGAPAA